jgi:sirohydrochlorin cobaltochelatase
MAGAVSLMKQGLLLVAHGARDPQWATPFSDIARRIRAQVPDVALELSFLEIMPPSLEHVAQRLITTGCVHIDVVPLFLGAGSHVLKDLPALVAKMEANHPAVRWRLHRAVGEIEPVLAAIASAAVALMADPSESCG